MMNLLSQVVLLSTLCGAIFSEDENEYMFIKVEYEMPIEEVMKPEDEPAHGTCYNNTALLCPLSKVGTYEASPVNPCLDCVCTAEQVYYCCRRVAEPIIGGKPKCQGKLRQDQVTCKFELPKIKCAGCHVKGWYTTELPEDLEDVFAKVPEGGLKY